MSEPDDAIFDKLDREIYSVGVRIQRAMRNNPDFWWSIKGIDGVMRAEDDRKSWDRESGSIRSLALSDLVRRGILEESKDFRFRFKLR